MTLFTSFSSLPYFIFVYFTPFLQLLRLQTSAVFSFHILLVETLDDNFYFLCVTADKSGASNARIDTQTYPDTELKSCVLLPLFEVLLK